MARIPIRAIEKEIAKAEAAERRKRKLAKTREHPLRKVVSYDGRYQTLSCGHRLRPKEDMLRVYENAKSRRCELCTKAIHPERYCVEPECLDRPSERYNVGGFDWRPAETEEDKLYCSFHIGRRMAARRG
jgi:hypothetical protein